ncbi:MAG: hypothetical protein II063_05520, partial [Prevotella sp.]|nr:hypothetical protein [Prevotella sp.]
PNIMKDVFPPNNQHHQMNDSSNKKQTIVQHYADGTASVMRKAVVYAELRFYQRSDVLYQLTQVFANAICLDMATVQLTKWYKLPAAPSRILRKAVLTGRHLQKQN